jgi:hypothetical protein
MRSFTLKIISLYQPLAAGRAQYNKMTASGSSYYILQQARMGTLAITATGPNIRATTRQ